jgi:microcystin-dependent protein
MDQYVGQLLLVGFNFAPSGWALCQGQLLPISQNTALFSLLGTYYGGDGRSTFALPNLQGVMPIGQGQGVGQPNYVIGQTGGEQTLTLISSQVPAHSHSHTGTSQLAVSAAPNGGTFGEGERSRPLKYYVAAPTSGTLALMNPQAVQGAGGGLAHENMMPYVVMNYIIALTGIFPPRS